MGIYDNMTVAELQHEAEALHAGFISAKRIIDMLRDENHGLTNNMEDMADSITHLLDEIDRLQTAMQLMAGYIQNEVAGAGLADDIYELFYKKAAQ